MSDFVRVVEVGPRDGLQNEAVAVSVETRIEFIEKLIAAGLTSIEAGSFVSPKWVPQMADTAEVLKAFAGRSDVALPVLVPNEKGLDAGAKSRRPGRLQSSVRRPKPFHRKTSTAPSPHLWSDLDR